MSWMVDFYVKSICKYTILPWIRNGLRKPLQWDCVDVSMRTDNLLQGFSSLRRKIFLKIPEKSWCDMMFEWFLYVFVDPSYCSLYHGATINEVPWGLHFQSFAASTPRVWSDRRRKNLPRAFRQKVGLNEEEAGFLAESFCGPVCFKNPCLFEWMWWIDIRICISNCIYIYVYM